MKFSTLSSLIAAASLALSVSAAPSPNPSELVGKDLEARASCNTAYNGNTASKRGPGTLYSCSSVSWVISSYVCYVSSTVSGPYCCSGNLEQTSAGPMVGGCF